MGTDAFDYKQLRFLDTITIDLRVTQVIHVGGGGGLDFISRAVPDENRLAPPFDGDRLTFGNARDVDLNGCQRQGIGGRVHLVDQWIDNGRSTHRHHGVCGHHDEIPSPFIGCSF